MSAPPAPCLAGGRAPQRGGPCTTHRGRRIACALRQHCFRARPASLGAPIASSMHFRCPNPRKHSICRSSASMFAAWPSGPRAPLTFNSPVACRCKLYGVSCSCSQVVLSGAALSLAGDRRDPPGWRRPVSPCMQPTCIFSLHVLQVISLQQRAFRSRRREMELRNAPRLGCLLAAACLLCRGARGIPRGTGARRMAPGPSAPARRRLARRHRCLQGRSAPVFQTLSRVSNSAAAAATAPRTALPVRRVGPALP